jgi:hypothetical protein
MSEPIIYILSAMPVSDLLPAIDRFNAAGFTVETNQEVVVRAIDSIIPGSESNEAWIVVNDDELDERGDLLKATGRLQGLRTVDPMIIVYRVNITDSPNLIRSFDWDTEVLRNEISLFVPNAIRYIATKLGERTAISAVKREAIENVDSSLEKHITPVLTNLIETQGRLRIFSIIFYSVAMVALLTGLVLAIIRAVQIHSTPPRSWVEIAGLAISGLIVIGMLSAVARFAFVLGRSFMVESLTNGDRAHAISFGRFYLQAFGQKIEWAEIKEAFQHWNTDRGSSFSAQAAADVDPAILHTAVEAAKIALGKAKD